MNRPFDTISKAELMKKHNFTKRNIIVYYFDHEPLGKIIQETRKILNCSRASLVSQALIHYCLFIQEKFSKRKEK